MSLANPMTVTEMFRRHGMATRILAPALQLQELAMAVSLQGRYAVSVDYCGVRHEIIVREAELHSRPAGADQRFQLGTLPARPQAYVIPLPREGQPAAEAGNELGAALQRLREYLMEGQPS